MSYPGATVPAEMAAVAWTAIGILAATLVGLPFLGTRIDGLGASLNARIDALDSNLSSRIDSMDGRLSAHIDALAARIDSHVDRHAG